MHPRLKKLGKKYQVHGKIYLTSSLLWCNHYMGTANHGSGNKEKAQAHFDKISEILGDNTLEKMKKCMEIWHEMTVYEEMMPVYLEYGLK